MVKFPITAKYNKNKKSKKPAITRRPANKDDTKEKSEYDRDLLLGGLVADVDNKVDDDGVDSDGEEEEKYEAITFTLKQLIRKLHIVEPVDHVMSLLGKRYA